MKTLKLPTTLLNFGRFMTDEMFAWVKANCDDRWYFEPDHFDPDNTFHLHLPNAEAAMLFMLTWCGEDVC